MKCSTLAGIAALALGTLVQAQSPFDEGPYRTEYRELETSEEDAIDHDISVFSPDEAGNFPVVYFVQGLLGLIPPSAYSAMLLRVASHGYTIIAPHHLNLTVDEIHGQWLDDVDVWCRENLEERLIAEGFNENITLDFENQYLLGHSTGSHVLCEYLKADCHAARGFVMVSPVDGIDPLGIIQDFCVTEGEKLNFDIPSLIISGGLDAVPAPNRNISCVSPDFGAPHFFGAMTGTTWMVNAVEYGHADMVDLDYWTLMSSVNLCAANDGGLGSLREFRYFVAGEIVAFLKGIHNGECDMFQYLEDPSTHSVEVELSKQEIISNEELCEGGGYCRWSEPQS